MSRQITVRLPDELVGFLDAVVESGGARSRSDVVAKALEREPRRLIAERDAEIRRLRPDPELAEGVDCPAAAS
jgi:Arc/MetJ-type ribon-helix-helix transcriptional regulator